MIVAELPSLLVHESVVDWPSVISVGLAVNEVMVGGGSSFPPTISPVSAASREESDEDKNSSQMDYAFHFCLQCFLVQPTAFPGGRVYAAPQ